MTHASSEPRSEAGAVIDAPGWAMGPQHADTVGVDARGSWLLEPETRSGMLLYPRDWSFVERRDVLAHLRSEGWSVVPIARFLHLTGDGTTVIRLLTRSQDDALPAPAVVVRLHRPTGPDRTVGEASI